MSSRAQQATVSLATWQVRETAPGSWTVSSLTKRKRRNLGDPVAGAVNSAPLYKCRKRGQRQGDRKSEVPIVAKNAGNAAGAKGHRFEITGKGNMTRHRADSDHDN